MEKIVKLCAVYTEDIEELKNMFVDSIKDDWELNIKKLESIGDNTFNSYQFVMSVTEKLNFFLKNIEDNIGNIIICSDVDIIFYRKCNDVLLDLMKDKDILFQADHLYDDHMNSGFVVIRCNEKTKKLYEDAIKLDLSKLEYHDQSALQIGIDTNTYDLNWGLLPYYFCADTHYAIIDLIPNDIMLHHANGTNYNHPEISTLNLKIERLNIVKNNISSNMIV